MNIVPMIAFALAFGAFLASIARVRGYARSWEWRNTLLWASTFFALLTVLVLLFLFLVVDVSYEYVFLYTSTDVPWRYRIAGVWAGRQGSLALWAFWAIAIAAWVSRTWRTKAQDMTLVFLTGFAAAFLGAVAWQDTFALTSDFFLQQRPGGNGLNPTLQSDFFLIHPPMMFLAYALTNLPAAAALAHVFKGDNEWSEVATHLSRWNWLWYTAAMGLGGVWAYYTLGFGGYWAWDPVEVANLLPWLALTVYLHAQLHHRKHGRYTTIGPFLAMLPFLLTLFSTISTRSGLWVSVHAFTDPTQTFNPDAVGRFQDILAVETTLQFYVGLLIAVTLLFLSLWSRRLAIEHNVMLKPMRVVAALLLALGVWSALNPETAYGALATAAQFVALGRTATGLLALTVLAVVGASLPSFLSKEEGKLRLDLQGLNYAAVLILGLGLLILWLWHMVAANGWSTEFYEVRLPFLALPAVTALTIFMAMPHGKKVALRIAGASLFVAIVVGIFIAPFAGFLVAALVFASLAIERTRLALTRKAQPRVQVGRAILALAALANVAFWINPPSTLLGFLSVQWPVQLLAIPSAWLLHRSFRHLAGESKGIETTQWLTGILGGYYITPVLAIASRLLDPAPRPTPFQVERIRQGGLYLVHLAVALALVGYGTSTYLGDEDTFTLERGQSATLGNVNVVFIDTDTTGGRVQEYAPNFEINGDALSGQLYWEPLTGSYYPLPSTLRWWHGDAYLAVEQLCTGNCSQAETVTVYEATIQRPPAEVSEVTFTFHTLPGLGLVWLALVLFVQGMWMLTHSGIALTTKSSRDTT